MEIQLPYGKDTVPCTVDEKHLLQIIKTKDSIPPDKPERMIQQSLNRPYGTEPLSELAQHGDRVAIVVDDYTRPSPTKLLLPPVLNELKKAGVVDTDVTIIIATGTHTPPSFETIKSIVGDKISRNYTTISNDNKNSDYVSVGNSQYGNTIEILQDYVDADIKILVGDIEYHYFAGYGGTRKSVLPGIASAETIQNNHAMMFHQDANTGILSSNPVSREMTEAMYMADCDFALSCVLNAQHQIVGVWAGDASSIMNAGVKLVDEMYKKQIPKRPDILITAADGHPHDINLYQALKALYTASQVISEQGVIILVAACPEGMGNDRYINWMKNYETSEEIKQALQKHFKIGAHKAFYHRDISEKNTVILVSEMNDSFVKDKLGFIPAKDPNEALMKAKEITGENAILVVPQGTTTHLVTEE
ncbi:MAG: nickel-dependent lactate racemase [Thermoplasmatota archaeon]